MRESVSGRYGGVGLVISGPTTNENQPLSSNSEAEGTSPDQVRPHFTISAPRH